MGEALQNPFETTMGNIEWEEKYADRRGEMIGNWNRRKDKKRKLKK